MPLTRPRKHITEALHQLCVCDMSVILTWTKGSDASVRGSVGRLITPWCPVVNRRPFGLSPAPAKERTLNAGGLETVDILFTLVQQVNRNRAGPLRAWAAVICIWEGEWDRREGDKDGVRRQTQTTWTDPPALWGLAWASISQTALQQREREREIGGTGRCTDSRLHDGTLFLSSISMQNRREEKNTKRRTLVVHWPPTVTRPWHPGVLIGRGGHTEEDYIYLRG